MSCNANRLLFPVQSHLLEQIGVAEQQAAVPELRITSEVAVQLQPHNQHVRQCKSRPMHTCEHAPSETLRAGS